MFLPPEISMIRNMLISTMARTERRLFLREKQCQIFIRIPHVVLMYSKVGHVCEWLQLARDTTRSHSKSGMHFGWLVLTFGWSKYTLIVDHLFQQFFWRPWDASCLSFLIQWGGGRRSIVGDGRHRCDGEQHDSQCASQCRIGGTADRRNGGTRGRRAKTIRETK